MSKKITLIGSTQYIDKFHAHAEEMRRQGHEVKIPAFDDFKGTVLELIDYNISIIKWADEVHVIWDARSIGTIFDLGSCFALGKVVKIIYLEEKTFPGLLREYEDRCNAC